MSGPITTRFLLATFTGGSMSERTSEFSVGGGALLVLKVDPFGMRVGEQVKIKWVDDFSEWEVERT